MPLLPSLITFLEGSKYFLIFTGCYIEGPAVMIATGVLWHLDIVSFWPAYVALLLGDLLADIMWYLIGYHAGRPFIARYGHWFNLTTSTIDKAEHHFHRHHTKILAFSKLTMGFGLAVPLLTVAGMLHVRFSRFVTINAIGGAIIVLVTMIVGYYFGNVLATIPENFRIAAIAAAALIFLLVIRTVSKKLATLDL